MKYVGYKRSASVEEAVAHLGAAVQTKVRKKLLREQHYVKPSPAPYRRKPEDIAAAMALARRQTGDKDLPEHPSPPIVPKSDRLVQLELDAFVEAELAKARRQPKNTREQLSLF